MWCDLNAYVISQYAQDPKKPEEDIFHSYMLQMGLSTEDQEYFRELAQLSPKAVVRGRNSLVHPVNVWWTRDQFLGGIDQLKEDFEAIIDKSLVEDVLAEKQEAVNMWTRIVWLSNQIKSGSADNIAYLKTSADYGLYKYSIIEQAWTVMLLGLQGDITGEYDKNRITSAIKKYDKLWLEYTQFVQSSPNSATLYHPYYFKFEPPDFLGDEGMATSIEKYRFLQ
ncbi:MAG: hypothetical protein HC830_14085 [Bacteroidetes bacterium]|nr:hypothetical protein [Bacteroidota bacterium]